MKIDCQQILTLIHVQVVHESRFQRSHLTSVQSNPVTSKFILRNLLKKYRLIHFWRRPHARSVNVFRDHISAVKKAVLNTFACNAGRLES